MTDLTSGGHPSPEFDWKQTAKRLLASGKLSTWEDEFLRSILRRNTITERQAQTLSRVGSTPDAGEIAVQLRERIEDLAEQLVGDKPTSRTRSALRFYPRGGLAVEIAGDRRGIWCDHGARAGGDPLDLVCHLRKCSTAEALKWATDWLGDALVEALPARPSRPAEPAKADTFPTARRLWQEAVAPHGGPAAAYLASRGLALPDGDVMRFHPACPRGRDERLPAMIALMTHPETGEPVGIHRTYLRPDGAGKVEHGTAKMMLGNAGVIRLVEDTEVTMGLGIAEGIETGLGIMQIAGWRPVWACASAGGIAKFPVLPGIECLTLFADRDDAGAGMKAAIETALRWQSCRRDAIISQPPNGNDWLDALAVREVA